MSGNLSFKDEKAAPGETVVSPRKSMESLCSVRMREEKTKRFNMRF